MDPRVPTGWVPHRREDDRELLGWIRPDGDAWVPVSLLGRDVGPPGDWLDAEATLDGAGLAWLGALWVLDTVNGPEVVRIIEVTPARVVLHTDDHGAIDMPSTRFELPWPAPETLRPRG